MCMYLNFFCYFQYCETFTPFKRKHMESGKFYSSRSETVAGSTSIGVTSFLHLSSSIHSCWTISKCRYNILTIRTLQQILRRLVKILLYVFSCHAENWEFGVNSLRRSLLRTNIYTHGSDICLIFHENCHDFQYFFSWLFTFSLITRNKQTCYL